jgi:hypothetical protein
MFFQVSQKGLYMLSGPFPQRFSREEIGEGFRPVDIKSQKPLRPLELGVSMVLTREYSFVPVA